MKILYWNIHRNEGIFPYLNGILREHAPELFILSELPEELRSILLSYVNHGLDLEYNLIEPSVSDPFYFSRLASQFTKVIQTEECISALKVRLLNEMDFLVFANHLPSQLYWRNEELSLYSTRIIQVVDKIEERCGHKRSVVIGDFNMNPFDSGIISFEGFHAVMDRNIAKKGSRKVASKEKTFFYNPMWSVYAGYPKGTYYYNSSTPINLYWHCFDQVLIRPALLDYFRDDNVQVLLKAGNFELLNKNGIPDKKISDHLPILLTLNTESEGA